MSDVAALVAPSVRWHDEYGYALAAKELETARELGCRAALMHGGPLAETRALLAGVRAGSPHAWLVAAELGSGAGERFPGATALPPLAALDAADGEAMRRAARLTAREARGAGINCAVAPSCILPGRAPPIVRARTFDAPDQVAAAACAEWIDACQAEGVVAMPGPYPLMRAAAADAALDAGVGALLLASSHADDAALIAYLRREAGFDGIIAVPLGALSNARDEDESVLAVQCIAAGVDLLLGCDDTAEVVRALRTAEARGELSGEQVRAACLRIDARAAWADVSAAGREPTLDDVLWARRAADAAVHVTTPQRGRPPRLRTPVELVIVDDDLPRPDRAGAALREALDTLGVEMAESTRGTLIVAVFGDRRITLGFDTYSDGARDRVRLACAAAAQSARDAIVVHFTPPGFGDAFESCPVVVCAWSGTRAMEEAVARCLSGRAGGLEG
ncbi:MAG TPA: hypothetical protein VE967_08950 [Gemmatimonadaceae bacterium]|nr:hypothetical protein [Gemmatimonadaceae bacterium]